MKRVLMIFALLIGMLLINVVIAEVTTQTITIEKIEAGKTAVITSKAVDDSDEEDDSQDTSANSVAQKARIRIEKTANERIAKIRAEENEVEAETELEVEEKIEEGISRIRARISDGTFKNIEISPERAREIIKQRLKIKAEEAKIELKEKLHKNIPRVVYNIQTEKPGKFLGIFKIATKVNSDVDAETGEVLQVRKPWWSFLVRDVEPSANTDDTTDNIDSSLDSGNEEE